MRSVFHRLIEAAVGLFNRNPWTTQTLEFLPRVSREYYRQDALWTYHSHHFMDDPKFQRAYQRSVKASGWDYQIEWRIHTLLWAAQNCVRNEGAFVECGTGRSFMASAMCEFLEWKDRPFYLIDTFESQWTSDDGTQVGPASAYYAESAEKVAENVREWPGVQLVVGRIPDVLSSVPEGPVAMIHIDLNNADAEEASVRHFWPRLSRGGCMVFDDYGWLGFDRQRERVDALGRELGFYVLAMPTGQGLVLKS
ncbi:MAG: methyltransferase MtfD [Aeromicrobium sp.]|nr:methyltransferase MtfD [Aeromicrobium sp.]